MTAGRRSRVRPARIRDIPAVVGMWHQLMRFHYPFDEHFRERRNGARIWGDYVKRALRLRRKFLVLVAEVDGEPAGYCLATESTATAPPLKPYRRGVIMDMFIVSRYRRCGLGRRMFLEAKRWFTRMRVPRIEVLHVCANSGAVAFWRRMGFRPAHQRSFLRLARQGGRS